ncbi:Transcriptional regulator, YafY family [Citrifermentans bremense]|uniref:Transcriptional regulator, YafY family n=1 Tax=Citrifermentans bremense TaxID=60035 RepID=A0A6S6M8U8_9BACT|nr:WYL domain-containing protein [Citrifermentans bremense]BCG47921.1 Transcriptional regulator, YafY family [Citrifermentans bremense]
MGEQLFLERFIWFDNEARRDRYPNAFKLAAQFEISTKTAQRSIDYFRDRLQAPLEYLLSHKGYRYTDSSFQLPVTRISEAELLALLISRKLITEASAGSLAEDLEKVSRRLGSLLAANLPGRAKPEDAFSFRWKGISPTDPLTFKVVTSAILQGKLLSFCYYSPTASNCTMRTVEPHHMVNYMGNWHLIAFCRLRSDWRDFVLGRMTFPRVEEDLFKFRANEEWRPFLSNTFGIFQNRKSFDVVLRFTPDRARWVRGELWHEGQKEVIEADGSLLLTISASHEAEIVMEILKHGSQVVVVEPEWLRQKVALEIEQMSSRYLHH